MFKEIGKKAAKIHQKIKSFTGQLSVGQIALLAALALLVFWYLQGNLAAAVVNGQPISRAEVVAELEKRYGSEALDSLITEALIKSEAGKNKIFVADEEINQGYLDLEQSLKDQGQDLESILALQGMTKEDVKEQLKIQKLIEKILGEKVVVSDQEIDEYLVTNKDYLPEGLSEGQLRQQARDQLTQQKLSQEFQTWIAQLRQEAKINIFSKY